MWIKIRWWLLVLAFVTGLLTAPQAVFTFSRFGFPHGWIIPCGAGLLTLVLIPPALLAVVGIQTKNPLSAEVWKKPRWSESFLTLGDPLRVFHFGGWFSLSCGLGFMAATPIVGPDALVLGAGQVLGAIVLLGSVRLCMRVYRFKYQPEPLTNVEAEKKEQASLTTTDRRIRRFKVLGVLILLAAPVPAAFGIWYHVSRYRFMADAVSAEGTVVGFTGSGKDTVRTLAEFHDASGYTRQAVSDWASSPPSHELGEKVEVFYLPADPNRAMVGRPLYWLVNLIAIPMFIGDVAIGMGFIWLAPRILRRKQAQAAAKRSRKLGR